MCFRCSLCIVAIPVIVSTTVLHCIGTGVARRVRVRGIMHGYTTDDIFPWLRNRAVKQKQKVPSIFMRATTMQMYTQAIFLSLSILKHSLLNVPEKHYLEDPLLSQSYRVIELNGIRGLQVKPPAKA